MASLDVNEGVKELRTLAKRARNGAETADVLGMAPARIVPAAIGIRDEGDGHAIRCSVPAQTPNDNVPSANGSASAMSKEQDRAVADAEVREGSGFVENLPAPKLEDEITVHLRLGEERLERAHFHGEQWLARGDEDSHRVPDLRHLDPNGDARSGGRGELDRRGPCAELRDEEIGHACTEGRVEKKRASCMSKRYVEPVTRVPPSAGETPMTISSPPWPRKLQKVGPSLSMKAEYNGERREKKSLARANTSFGASVVWNSCRVRCDGAIIRNSKLRTEDRRSALRWVRRRAESRREMSIRRPASKRARCRRPVISPGDVPTRVPGQIRHSVGSTSRRPDGIRRRRSAVPRTGCRFPCPARYR